MSGEMRFNEKKNRREGKRECKTMTVVLYLCLGVDMSFNNKWMIALYNLFSFEDTHFSVWQIK